MNTALILGLFVAFSVITLSYQCTAGISASYCLIKRLNECDRNKHPFFVLNESGGGNCEVFCCAQQFNCRSVAEGWGNLCWAGFEFNSDREWADGGIGLAGKTIRAAAARFRNGDGFANE